MYLPKIYFLHLMNSVRRLIASILLVSAGAWAQPPKLVVIIVLDQFPYEQLSRFSPYFGSQGINSLVRNGASFTNARYDYAFTMTAPGHAAIMSGAYGHLNGIIANRWWDRANKQTVGAVDDSTVHILGRGGMGHSPRNLRTYTLGDMLRMHTNFRSKVISISHKDRSAILMGGKLGMAYWMDDSVFLTSGYYRGSEPRWMQNFNHSSPMRQYFGRAWTEVLPAVASRICDDDDVPYEQDLNHLGRMFPHMITGNDPRNLTPSFYDALYDSPFMTEVLLAAARSVFAAETLGGRGVSDLLCISVSTTDGIGHDFGPQSHEVFDDAVRTDSMIGGFLNFLDSRVGLENCLVALTSDHGIAPIPEYLKKHGLTTDAGRVSSSDLGKIASSALDRRFGSPSGGGSWIERVLDTEVYINRDAVAQKGISLSLAQQVVRDAISAHPQVAAGFTADEIVTGTASGPFAQRVEHSFLPERSGDVLFVLKPYYILSGDSSGASHGSPYDYDTHVPLIISGRAIKPGRYAAEVSPVDLAPTIAEILGVEFPPGREGRVLGMALKEPAR